MIRSTNNDLNEYALVRAPEHIAKVWAVVESALPKYWDKFLDREREKAPDAQAALLAKFGVPAKTKPDDTAAVLGRVFEKAVADYEAEAEKYRPYLTPAAFEEYRDDPQAFMHTLSKDIPVVARTLHQRRAELRDWQIAFRRSRATDLLAVFTNVDDFREEWAAAHPPDQYATYDDPAVFGLDPLDDDEKLRQNGVIGMGIKSIVLFHLDPQRFPPRGRDGLYGLYFLSGTAHFGLPSKSSEFLMINDMPADGETMIMDQNYWYPYGAFSLYALRLYHWLEARAAAAGYTLDRTVRYVYVDRFFEAVCAEHAADLKTMRAHERYEVLA